MTEHAPVQPGQKQLGLVIDLDTCVGCHACATACKSWNRQQRCPTFAKTDDVSVIFYRQNFAISPEVRPARRE